MIHLIKKKDSKLNLKPRNLEMMKPAKWMTISLKHYNMECHQQVELEWELTV